MPWYMVDMKVIYNFQHVWSHSVVSTLELVVNDTVVGKEENTREVADI